MLHSAQGWSLPCAAAAPRMDPQGQGPAPGRNREEKSSDGFVGPSAPSRLPKDQAERQAELLGAAVGGAGFKNITILFLPCFKIVSHKRNPFPTGIVL